MKYKIFFLGSHTREESLLIAVNGGGPAWEDLEYATKQGAIDAMPIIRMRFPKNEFVILEVY